MLLAIGPNKVFLIPDSCVHCTTQPWSLLVSSFDDMKRTEWSLYHAAQSDIVGQCRQSIEALLPLFYEKAATSDMIRLGLALVRTTTASHSAYMQTSHYLSPTKHFVTLGITISDTFGKDTSVFDIGRPSHRDGLACGLLWEIFCFKTFQTRINYRTFAASLVFFSGLSHHLGSPE